jgi:hypothetical protein
MNDVLPSDQPGAASADGTAGGGRVAATLTALARQHLEQTRPWVRFMSVVTFLSAGLMALLGLGSLLFGLGNSLARGGAGVLGTVAGVALALLYLALAAVYVAPALYLWRYADAIERLGVNATAAGLEEALGHQRSFWRFVGILTAIGLVVGIAILGLAIMAGVLGAMMAAR